MRPFDGMSVLVIDPSPAVAMSGWLMGQMGADVTIMEPRGGSVLRGAQPFVNERSALFAFLAANAQSALLPFEDESLDVTDVHVVLHGRDELPRKWIEAIEGSPLPERGRVVVACTPYGAEGPRRGWQASEVVLFQAGGEGFLMPSGLAYERFPERSPIGVGRYVAHYQGGLSAAISAVAGLRSSRRVGAAEWADVSIQDIEVSLNYFTVSRFVEGVREDRSNRAFKYGGVLECSDGYVELVTLEQRQWEAMIEMLGRPSWSVDARFEDAVSRGQLGGEINDHLRSWTADRTVGEVVELAAEHGVPCGAYLAPQDLLGDVQLAARGYFVDVDEEDFGGPVAPSAPWQLLGWSAREPRPAPGIPSDSRSSL